MGIFSVSFFRDSNSSTTPRTRLEEKCTVQTPVNGRTDVLGIVETSRGHGLGHLTRSVDTRSYCYREDANTGKSVDVSRDEYKLRDATVATDGSRRQVLRKKASREFPTAKSHVQKSLFWKRHRFVNNGSGRTRPARAATPISIYIIHFLRRTITRYVLKTGNS